MKTPLDKFKVLDDGFGSPEADAGIKVMSIKLGAVEIQFKHLNQRHYADLCRHIVGAFLADSFDDAYHGQKALAIVWKTLGYSAEGFNTVCQGLLNQAIEFSGDGFLVTRYKTYLQKRTGRTVITLRNPRLH